MITEWGDSLTAGQVTQCAAGALAAVDNCTSSCNGLAAQLQVESITGACQTLTVVVQESSDNGCTDPFASLLSFCGVPQACAPTAVRKTTCGAVEQFLRINTTGCWSQAVYAVAARRGEACDRTAY